MMVKTFVLLIILISVGYQATLTWQSLGWLQSLKQFFINVPWYHTFVEIDHEIISTVILLPSTDLFKKGCCQLQAKVCAQITG